LNYAVSIGFSQLSFCVMMYSCLFLNFIVLIALFFFTLQDTNESCDEYDNDDNNRNDDWGNVVEEDNRDDDSDDNLDESDKDIDVSGGGTSATARRPSVDDAAKPVVTKQLSASSFDSHSSGDDSLTHRRKKVKSERDNTILTFEIFAKGDNKYCHRSMRNLFLYMLKSCQSQDAAGATPTFSFNENAPRGNVDDWARYISSTSPLITLFYHSIFY
jgi:hypothetical protein